jgi:hypothetical protein
MPRPTSEVETPADDAVENAPTTIDVPEAEQENAPAAAAESNGAAKPRRTRRTIVPPEGVTLGVLEEIVPGEPPRAATGRAGRSPDPKTVKAIQVLQENPGKWYKIGVFGSAASPDGLWKNAGVTFKNISMPEGLFERWAALNPVKGESPEAA